MLVQIAVMIVSIIGLTVWPPGSAFAQDQAGQPWVRQELPLVSFSSPSNWKLEHPKSSDSAIWLYSDDEVKVLIDLGSYSGLPNLYRELPNYVEQKVLIDGKAATIVSFDYNSEGSNVNENFLGVYFPKVTVGTKLSIVVITKTKSVHNDIRKVFNSIKFNQQLIDSIDQLDSN